MKPSNRSSFMFEIASLYSANCSSVKVKSPSSSTRATRRSIDGCVPFPFAVVVVPVVLLLRPLLFAVVFVSFFSSSSPCGGFFSFLVVFFSFSNGPRCASGSPSHTRLGTRQHRRCDQFPNEPLVGLRCPHRISSFSIFSRACSHAIPPDFATQLDRADRANSTRYSGSSYSAASS